MKRALLLLLALGLMSLGACSTRKPAKPSAPPGYEMDTTPGDNGSTYQ